MQGIFINGSRPKSKKQIRELVENFYLSQVGEHEDVDPYSLVIEATSMFGNEFDGSFAKLMNEYPNGHANILFVGPDPYTKRNFYGKIAWNDKKGRYIVS